MDLHWNILDERRREILPLFAVLAKEGSYLAGGTALALQLGHRDSIDFDFFIEKDFDIEDTTKRLEDTFSTHSLRFTQKEKNTLSFLIDDAIQVSLLGFKYPLLFPFVESPYFPLASLNDIACMKFSAITGRSVEKDYVDLYFILQQRTLAELLVYAAKKFPNLDEELILKSLVYFDDVSREPILFKEDHDVSFEVIQKFLRDTVKEYIA